MARDPVSLVMRAEKVGAETLLARRAPAPLICRLHSFP